MKSSFDNMYITHSQQDITEATDNYICCIASAVGRLLKVGTEPTLDKLVEKFPHANIYDVHKKSGKSKVGTFKILGEKDQRKIMILFSRLYPGNQITCNDNPSIRRDFFHSIMELMLGKQRLETIAFDHDQLTDEYIQLIDDFTKKYALRHPGNAVKVTIYNSLQENKDETGNKSVFSVKKKVISSKKTPVLPVKPRPVSKPIIKKEYLDITDLEITGPLLYEVDFAQIKQKKTLIDLFPQDDYWDWLVSDRKFINHIGLVEKTLGEELYADDTFPQPDEIFNAFNHCKHPKVVILGQDPYPNRGDAHGMSFSVRSGVKIPRSLSNIFSSMVNHVDGFVKPNHGNLTKWADQGVLLLNSGLTVKEQKPDAHIAEWSNCTDYIISAISGKYKNLVFVLWGSKAKLKKRLINKNNNHLILMHSHPVARQGSFATDCKNMGEINPYLEANGVDPIDWSL